MRTTGTHEEVIEAYADNKKGPYKGHNVYFKDNIIFSYGRHFPMAIRTNDGYGNIIVVNGDIASVSTTKHQSALRMALRRSGCRYFTTSFSAISNWMGHHIMNPCHGTEFEDKLSIVDYEEDRFHSSQQGIAPGDVPVGASVVTTKENIIIQWHLPASVLFKYQRSSEITEYALASMDENQFFVSEIPGKADTIGEAFDMLKPLIVKRAEEDQWTPCPRQGEWFFIKQDVKSPKKEYERMQKKFHLIGYNQGNSHVATRGYWLYGERYVSGQINHPEHKRLQLSYAYDPEIYMAVENTAVRSFSSNGNVD